MLCIQSCKEGTAINKKQHPGGAALAMEEWAMFRSYPEGKIWSRNLTVAHETKKATLNTRGFDESWEPIGPKNIGGRTLCLAFHPTDQNIIYAGSASGGLWKTTSQGIGYSAWEYVPTGHPVLGVPAIAINPDNPDEMYIGTGEVYNYTQAMPGVASRLTRGSYGVGILKTTDGGNTWTKSLDWSYGEMTGVADLLINPENTSTIFAATTEGLYRTQNAGDSWELIQSNSMATDIEMHPQDTNTLIVSFGNYLSPSNEKGVYRSQDGGDTFEELTDGLPDYTGKTLLSYSPSNPDKIYASVADAFVSIGLYKSENGGDTWEQVNNEDVAKYQGWYSHDVAVKPNDSEYLVYTGVDAFVSPFSGGQDIVQTAFWYLWDFGQVPVGGPEGPSDYVHADIHAAYYSPFDQDAVFLVTDGGVFYSGDNGLSWEGRNGSYQTQQFYPNFGNSYQDSLFAIGGMQDNSTALYVGDDAWVRILGGDGMSAMINPEDDNIVFGSSQNLNVRRSLDHGDNFSSIIPSEVFDENRVFNGPFELNPNVPTIIYAGAERLWESLNNGNDWSPTTTSEIDNGNPILKIGVSPANSNIIYVSMAPLVSPPAKVFLSKDGGQNWSLMTGLPDRMAMDFAFDPLDENISYVVYSGFGGAHVYKTEDGGVTWESIDNGLPDLPTNTIFVDPLIPSNIYVANDLSVYASVDYGENWDVFAGDLPDATLGMDLSISPVNRKLRLATHGNGIWQVDLLDEVSSSPNPTANNLDLNIFPNPATDILNYSLKSSASQTVQWQIVDLMGRKLLQSNGTNQTTIGTVNLSSLAAGHYFFQLEAGGELRVEGFEVVK